MRTPEFVGLGEIAANDVELILLEKARTDPAPLGGEEGEDHSPADEERVDSGQKMLDHAELVRHLRASENDGVRSGRCGGQPIEHVEFGCDEKTSGARKQFGELEHARLLAMHDAETVGDEGVAESGELRGELAALGVGLWRSPPR